MLKIITLSQYKMITQKIFLREVVLKTSHKLFCKLMVFLVLNVKVLHT